MLIVAVAMFTGRRSLARLRRPPDVERSSSAARRRPPPSWLHARLARRDTPAPVPVGHLASPCPVDEEADQTATPASQNRARSGSPVWRE
jgi:hypothetical protein